MGLRNILRTKVFRWSISVTVTAGVLFLLSLQVSLSSLAAVFGNLSWSWFAGGVFIFFLSTILRAWRLKYLGMRQVSLRTLMNISFFHYFLSGLLPWRSGEFSFLYFSKKDGKVPFPVAVSALIISRLFDFLSVIIWVIVGIVFVFPEKIVNFDPLVVSVGALLLAFTMVFLSLLFGREFIQRVVFSISQTLGLQRFELSRKIAERWHKFSSEVELVKNHKTLSLVFALTLPAWFLIGLVTLFFMRGLGFSAGLWQMVFITSFPPIATLLPLGAFGNFGTIEAGWSLGLITIGFPSGSALTLSVALHLLTILMQLIGVLYALALRAWKNNGF